MWQIHGQAETRRQILLCHLLMQVKMSWCVHTIQRNPLPLNIKQAVYICIQCRFGRLHQNGISLNSQISAPFFKQCHTRRHNHAKMFLYCSYMDGWFVYYHLSLFNFSIYPAVIMPAGNATIAMPNTDDIIVITFPAIETAYMYP